MPQRAAPGRRRGRAFVLQAQYSINNEQAAKCEQYRVTKFLAFTPSWISPQRQEYQVPSAKASPSSAPPRPLRRTARARRREEPRSPCSETAEGEEHARLHERKVHAGQVLLVAPSGDNQVKRPVEIANNALDNKHSHSSLARPTATR